MLSITNTRNALPRLSEDLHNGLKLWHKVDSEDSPLEYLMLYRLARREATNNRQATNEVLHAGIQHLAARYPDAALVLRLRFLDHQLAHAVANHLNVAESTIYALQREAIERLAETLLDLEQQARAAHQNWLLSRLEPPTYGELIGVERHIEELTRILLAVDQADIICISGIGGIGKTALADALLRHLVSSAAFESFGWVTARQTAFQSGVIRPVSRPALTAEALIEALLAQFANGQALVGALTPQQALEALSVHLQQPCLVVVDNLETVQDVETLLPVLRQLAGPSKFVLTSRHSHFFEPAIHRFVVPELSEVDALHLVRRETCLQGLAALSKASDDELRPIYQTIGGHPLALRLVVARCCSQSLDEVLADLAVARGRNSEDLYLFIFDRSWEKLTRQEQTVLLAMVAVAEAGATREDLVNITALDPGEVGDAIETLANLNLLDYRRNGLHETRYGIHQLTRRFLEQKVRAWGR
jgi:hypothetical protein